MTTVITNLLNMIRAVLLYCTGNTTATSGITNFATKKAAIDTKMVLLDQLEQIALGNSSGTTASTKAIREAMVKLALKCADPLVVYANSTDPINEVLLNKVNFTKSDMKAFKKEEIGPICQTIHDQADTNIGAAGGYGYDATDVSDLQTAITLYAASKAKPREAIITKSDAIEQIEKMTRGIIDKDLKLGLDRMVNTLEDTNFSFFNTYYKAREIINIGVTHAKIRGTVRNPLGTFLFRVRVFITKTGLTQVISETLTDAEGKFGIYDILPDDYDVHYEFSPYQTQIETNLHIPAGKEIKRKITLNFVTFYSATILPGEHHVFFGPSNPVWRPGLSLYIKNATDESTPSTASGYNAYSPTDPGPGSGDLALNSGQDITIDSVPADSFKPYFSYANTGTNPATIEITILP